VNRPAGTGRRADRARRRDVEGSSPRPGGHQSRRGPALGFGRRASAAGQDARRVESGRATVWRGVWAAVGRNTRPVRDQLWCQPPMADAPHQDNRLIIELKAAKALADEHVAQILGHLRSSRVEHGLLINLGAPRCEIKKYALSRTGEGSRPILLAGALSPRGLSRQPVPAGVEECAGDWLANGQPLPE
jgi:hypothetical protein